MSLRQQLDQPGTGETAGAGGGTAAAPARSPRRSCSGCAGARLPSPPASGRPGPRSRRRDSPSGPGLVTEEIVAPRPWPGARIAGNSSPSTARPRRGRPARPATAAAAATGRGLRSSRPDTDRGDDTSNSGGSACAPCPGSTTRTRTPTAADPAPAINGTAGASPTRRASAPAPAPAGPAALPGRPPRNLASRPLHRAPAHAQRRRHILGMNPGLDRVDRPESHLFQRAGDPACGRRSSRTRHDLQKCKIKSAYQRSCW